MNNNMTLKRLLALVLVVICFTSFTACGDVHAHEYGKWVVTEKATCEDEGLRERTCRVCGEKETEVLPLSAHTYVTDYGYAATETATGLTDGAHCSVCGQVLVEQKVIPKIKNIDEDYAYKVTIATDGHASVYVYETKDYEAVPELADIAFSRDGASGELVKDGSGQVNFELRFDDGYVLKEISLSTGYNALKTPADTGRENTYRITKITDDLVMFVSAQKKVELSDFASFTDDDGTVRFSWAADNRIEYTRITVKCNGDSTGYTVGGARHDFSVDNMWRGFLYEFSFTPYENGEAGKTTTCSLFYDPELKTVSFPRVEIVTQDHVWPTCDYIYPPSDSLWGAGITNNKYEQCIVSLYDKNNDCIYTSSAGKDYSSAKIKIRGNTSAHGEKKPYKIKLNSKADLLAGLLPNRNDKSYAHKEWLLLKDGDKAYQVLGSTVSKQVGMDYTPAFSYVECYVNGDYRGMYVLCESVSKGNGEGDEQARIAVSNSGFIVEMDAYWWNEDLYFTTPICENTAPKWTFKYPDPDDIDETSEEYLYIKDYITRFDNAILNGDPSFTDYVDLRSIAKWTLAHDILGTVDSGGSNIFFTKYDDTDGSVLKMGPLWDFDSICGKVEHHASVKGSNHYYYRLLLNNEDFIAYRQEIYDGIKDEILTEIEDNLDSLFVEPYDFLLEKEFARYFRYMHDDNKPSAEIKAEYMSWFGRHLAWLTEHLN